MDLGKAWQGKKCARCRHAIQSDPALDEHLWFHRTCLEEGQRAATRPRPRRLLRRCAGDLAPRRGAARPSSVSAAAGERGQPRPSP